MSNEKRWGFVVNPEAGKGKSLKVIERIKAVAEKMGVKIDVAVSESAEDAEAKARKFATDGYDYLIAVGGDGTVNQILQGAMASDKLTFGIVSAGTGNDFIEMIGFPQKFSDEDIETIFRAPTKRIDVGICNKRYFLNGIGMGMDAQVVYKYHQPSILKGKLKYYKSLLSSIFFFKDKPLVLEADDNKYQTESLMLTLGNGRKYGSGFFLLPEALIDDGLMDICLFGKVTPLKRIGKLLSVIRKVHPKDKKTVQYIRAKKAKVVFQQMVPAHIDGELLFDLNYEVEIIPKALNIIINDRNSGCWVKD